MLKRFITAHGDTAESLLKSGGGTLTLFALLSGPWTFGTLAAAAVALSGAVGGLRKLQEIAEVEFAGKPYRDKYRLLLALAAREAYLSAAGGEIPKTLKAYERTGIPTFGKPEDIGPELEGIVASAQPLADQAKPVFDFLEAKLLELMIRAEVPDSERTNCCQKIRREAEEELRCIVTGNIKRFGGVAFSQMLRASDHTLGGRNAAGRSASYAAPEPPLLPLENEAAGFVRAPEPTAPAPSSTLANASAPAPTLTGKLKALYEERFLKARQELEKGSSLLSAKLFEELAGELRTLSEPDLSTLLVRCLHNQGVSLYNTNQRLAAAACFEEALTYPQQTSRTKLGRFFAPYCREDFTRALQEIVAIIRDHPEETTYFVQQAECLWRLERGPEALALLEAHPSENESYYTLLSQLQATHRQFAQALETAKTGLELAPESGQLRMAALFAEVKPVFDRLHRERQTRRFITVADRQVFENACIKYEKVANDAKRDGLKVIEADATGMAGNIRLALGNSKEAIDWFDRSLTLVPTNETILAHKYLALMRSGDMAGARKLAEECASVLGMAESMGRQAAIHIEEGKFDAACELLDKAFAITPTLKENATLRIIWLQSLGLAKRPEVRAETLAFANEPDRSARDLISAAEIIESVGGRTETDKLISRAEKAAETNEEDGLLVRTVAGMIHFRRDAWGEAVARLGTNGMDPTESEHVTEIIVCLINLDDVPGAVKLAERMIELGRGSPAIERALAHCYLRIGQESAAEPLLRSIVARDGKFEDRLSLFHVTQRLRPLRTALPILEGTVKAFPDRMEGHLILGGVYYALRQYPLSLEEAREAQRLSPDHPQVLALFARYIPSNFPTKLLKESDKAMMRKAISDQKLFTKIEITERNGQPDITPILMKLRDRKDHVAHVLEQYRQLRLPLCFVASLLGETTFSLWWDFSRGVNERLYLTAGNNLSQQEEKQACEEAKAVVLDATALFTLAELGLLDLPGKCFGQLYVDTWTLVQLKAEQATLGLQPEKQQIAQYHEGKLLIRETDASEHLARVARLGEIVGFLHDNPKVKVHGPSAEVWSKFRMDSHAREMAKAMPDGAFGPLLTAISEGAAYYCDDLGMRGVLKKEWPVQSFSTQALLRRAVGAGFLDGLAYEVSVATMIRRNAYFVSVDREFILRHLQRERFVRERVADRLLEEIGSTTFPKSEGALELGVVAGHVWFNTYTANAPGRADWLKPIAQAVAGLPTESSAVLYFLLGLLSSLMHFPTLFIGLTDALIYEVGLPTKVAAALQAARYQVIKHLRTVPVMGDSNVAKKWDYTVKEAARCRKLAGIKKRV